MKPGNYLYLLFIFLIFISAEPIKFRANKVEYFYKKGKEKTICRGDAEIWRSDFYLRSNLIYIYGKDYSIAKCYGNVKIISRKDEAIITGGYAEYDNIKEYARVFKNPVLVLTNRKITIKSALMETYPAKQISIALGNVIVTGTNFIAKGEKGIYYKERGVIELTGKPEVIQNEDVFKGNKIVVYIHKKKIKLYGDIRAIMVSER